MPNRFQPGRWSVGVLRKQPDPMIGFRCNPDLLAQIEAYAAAHQLTKSEAVRRLVERGLQTEL